MSRYVEAIKRPKPAAKASTVHRARARTPFRVVETWDGWAAYSVGHVRMLSAQFHPHHVRLIHGRGWERTTDAILGRTPFEALLRLKRMLQAA